MKRLSLLVLVMLSSMIGACTANSARELIGHGLANAADTEVGYNASQCFTIRHQCQGGDFQVWQTSDGVEGCSCKM